MKFDADLLADGLAAIIREQVTKATEPLRAKIAELEARPAYDPAAAAARLVEVDDALKQLDTRVALLPLPIDERLHALDTRSAELLAKVADLDRAREPQPPPDHAEEFAAMRAALFGDLAEHMTALLSAKVAALPPPAKGDRGDNGTSVTVEDVQPLVDAQFATWSRDFERTARDYLQKQFDAVPKPRDGIDGLGFDDFTVDYDGERALVFRLKRGEQVREFPFTLPIPLYREIYKRGQTYALGDCVTWGGAMWIAQAETDAQPAEEGEKWKLCVRRGRDGDRGRGGENGKDGKHGRDGVDRVFR